MSSYNTKLSLNKQFKIIYKPVNHLLSKVF